MIVVPRRRMDEHGVELALAPQVVLRQRGPEVGQARYIAHQHDPPFIAVLEEGFCRLLAGQTGADDHDRSDVRHRSPHRVRPLPDTTVNAARSNTTPAAVAPRSPCRPLTS